MSTPWYGTLPERWKVHKLKRLVRDVTDIATASGKFYIGLENILSWKAAYIKTISIVDGDSKIFAKDDILFGKLRPYLAKVFVPKEEGVCSGEFLVLRGYEGNVDYLKYVLLSYGFIMDVDSSTYGAKMPRASWSYIGNCEIPIPPRHEQDQIVRYLDWKVSRIDKLINAKWRQIELLREQKRVILTSVLAKKVGTWNICRLKDICRLKTGSTPRNNEGINTDGNGYCWVTPSDFGISQIIDVTQKYISEFVLHRDGIILFPEGSVLFIGIGGTLGKFALLGCKAYSNQQITAIIPFNIDSKFLLYVLTEKSSYIKSTANYTTLPIVNNTRLEKIEISFPHLEEQKTIVAQLDMQYTRIDKTLAKLSDEITLLTEYRTRLISDAVTGKLDVRGVTVPDYEKVEESATAESSDQSDGDIDNAI